MHIRTGVMPLLITTIVLALGACGDSPVPDATDDTSGSVATDGQEGARSEAAGRDAMGPSSTPLPGTSGDDPEQGYLVCVAEVSALAELLTRLQIGTAQEGVRWNGLLAESQTIRDAGHPEEATELCERVRDEMTEAARASAGSTNGD